MTVDCPAKGGCWGPGQAAHTVLQPEAGWQAWEPAEEGSVVPGSSPSTALGARLPVTQGARNPWFSWESPTPELL